MHAAECQQLDSGLWTSPINSQNSMLSCNSYPGSPFCIFPMAQSPPGLLETLDTQDRQPFRLDIFLARRPMCRKCLLADK